MSEGGGREGSSEGGSWGLVAQIWEVQGRVGGAGGHIWKRQTLHVWRDRGEGKRCGATMRGYGARQTGSWWVLVGEMLSSIWIDKRCRGLIAGLIISCGDRFNLQRLTGLSEQRVS